MGRRLQDDPGAGPGRLADGPVGDRRLDTGPAQMGGPGGDGPAGRRRPARSSCSTARGLRRRGGRSGGVRVVPPATLLRRLRRGRRRLGRPTSAVSPIGPQAVFRPASLALGKRSRLSWLTCRHQVTGGGRAHAGGHRCSAAGRRGRPRGPAAAAQHQGRLRGHVGVPRRPGGSRRSDRRRRRRSEDAGRWTRPGGPRFAKPERKPGSSSTRRGW